MKFISMMGLRTHVIKLIATFFCLMTLVSCGGGGGWGGTPSGTPAALFTSAPSSLSLVMGTARNFTITGGRAPYTISSSDTSFVAVAMSDNNFSITAVQVGSSTVEIKDMVGAVATVAVTVTDGSSATPLYTTAPSALTLVVGTAQTYTISGGLAPYTVNSSNQAKSVASVTGNKLNIVAVSVGAATIGILDASGKSISVSVTVSDGSSATPLYTTAPGNVTISNGGTRTYTIGGGLAPYTATSSDTIIATTSVVGSTLSIEGIVGGSTSVLVRDAANTIVTIGVKVGFSNTFFTTAPSTLTILVGAAPVYTISGGSLNYAASSSNSNIVQATVVGSSLTIAGVAAGTATVSVLDSTGASVAITVKVSTSPTGVDTAFYTTAPAIITIAPGVAHTYGLGGGTAPYTATTSNASVATATASGTGLTLSGFALGSAQIRVIDSVGTALTLDVTVSAGVVTAFYTTAPASITLAPGAAPTYGLGGGTGPYTATTSNASVATASASGAGLTITGVASGSAQIRVVDSTGTALTIDVTVSAGAVTAFYTTAPASITLAPSVSSIYALGGGTAPYTATTSNASVATATASGTGLTITGVASGSAQIRVVDSTGTALTVTVTVSVGVTTAPTVLPSAASANVGDVLNFSISGASAPYSLTVNNASIATISTSSVAASGGTFTATLRNVGSTLVTIVDAVGQTTTLTLTANATSTTLRLSPSTMQIGENNTAAIILNIYGGTAPYRAFTSDLVLSSVTSTGTTFTAAVGSAGNRCITATAFATYDVTLTVVDNLGASATSIMTIKDNGGAACP